MWMNFYDWDQAEDFNADEAFWAVIYNNYC